MDDYLGFIICLVIWLCQNLTCIYYNPCILIISSWNHIDKKNYIILEPYDMACLHKSVNVNSPELMSSLHHH